MDFIQSVHLAIDYMEKHLLEPITYEDVAKYLYMSSYHLHRIFSLIMGMTANEYIKSRRLSLAGQELLMSTVKVIDVSLKYCYDSPESFAKAFTRFHGVSPNVARHTGNELKLFNRLHIKITMEGGKPMDYRIEKRMPFKLLAKVEEFGNEIINETEIPIFLIFGQNAKQMERMVSY